MSINTRRAFLGQDLGINFALGVVTGIPMNFNSGRIGRNFQAAAAIGQTLAMEESFPSSWSQFPGAFLYGEKRLGESPRWAAFFVSSARDVRLSDCRHRRLDAASHRYRLNASRHRTG